MLTPLLHNADADLDADIKNMALPGSADVKRLEANGPCFISLVWSRWTIWFSGIALNPSHIF